MPSTIEPLPSLYEPASPLSARIQRLKEAVLSDTPDRYVPRAVLVTESYAETEGQPQFLRQAKALARVIEGYPVRIDPDELIVGYQQHESGRGMGFAEHWDLTTEEKEQQHLKRIAELEVSDFDKERLRKATAYWRRRSNRVRIGPDVSPTFQAEMEAGVYFGSGRCEGHTVPDYEKVLRTGFAGIRAQIAKRIERLDLTDPGDLPKKQFLDGAFVIADAACRLGHRYAERARELALTEGDPVRKEELREIADICDQVPEGPARTFREAIQALWFAHMIMGWEDGINANSIGRIDQFLYPYYEADLREDRLTRDEARELIECLWLKLYKTYDVQQAILGGQTPDGRDATNDLTVLCLEATRDLGLIRCLSVRVHRGTPMKLLEAAFELVEQGGGIPFFFNDEAIIPALVDKGIPLEEARNYAIIGCVEVTIPGKTNPHAVSHMMNLAKCFELALNDGRDPATGVQLGPRTGMLADFSSADQVLDAYKAQFEYFAAHAVQVSNTGELNQPYDFPLPYHSILTSDCVERGRDLTQGGAVYNYHSTCAIGIPNVADSIMALQKLVFEEGRLTLEEMADLLRTDFHGREDRRQMLLKGAPKYGNDEEEVDRLAAEVAEHYCRHMATYRTVYGGTFHAHLFSFVWNINPCGKKTGALPDGRRKGEPVAYSLSPMQGRDHQGLTAMLNSLARIPHHLSAGSSSAIIGLDPVLFRGEGRRKTLQLVKTAIDRGVGQMQFNVVSADTLRNAQQHPDQYRNLAVRVSGYSYRFCLLDKDMQDHIIARTKHER